MPVHLRPTVVAAVSVQGIQHEKIVGSVHELRELQKDGEGRISMIRGTNSTLDDSKLRPTEFARIKSAKRHFEAIGDTDYDRPAPGDWNL